MVVDLRYFNSLEHELDSLKSQLKTQKTQFLNEIDRLSREYYYVDHMNAILGVYTTLDEFTDLQCDYVDQVAKCERLENKLSKRNTTSKFFEALQQHAINLELALQQITAQILPQNMKSILKNTKVIALGMYKVHIKPNQTRTPQLPQDIRKTNKSVSFSIGVVPTTSVSRPQLKSNRLEDRTSNVNFVCVTYGKCLLNDNHDTFVLHYINGVNSRTKMPMAMPISTREPKRTVNQFVTTSLKKIVALASTNQKPRSKIRKQYEQISTVKFGNDQIALILGYGDLVQANVTIKRVYYVEGLNHNLFSICQFCDADFEVAF
ncbi:hypothetical protein Tco_1435816 [Tanacetum coccineum]